MSNVGVDACSGFGISSMRSNFEREFNVCASMFHILSTLLSSKLYKLVFCLPHDAQCIKRLLGIMTPSVQTIVFFGYGNGGDE